jgi:hypothetical protein
VKAFIDERNARWQAKWDAGDAAKAKALRISLAERAVIQAAEEWRELTAPITGCEYALTKVVDDLREARK